MKKMTQSDREIKTISKKIISRDFVSRDLMFEEKILREKVQEPTGTEPTSRREVIQNIIPAMAQGAGTLLRSLSVKLAETLEKLEKL